MTGVCEFWGVIIILRLRSMIFYILFILSDSVIVRPGTNAVIKQMLMAEAICLKV
jgi:hypothetical protein